MGADFIEQDVQMTRDGVPVVLHDRTLDAVSNVAKRFPGRARADGRHYVADFTLAEIATLRIGARIRPDDGARVFPGRHDGTGDFRIPTLADEIRFIEELNRTTGRRAGLYVEIKDPAFYRAEGHDIARAVVENLSAAGLNDPAVPVYIQCFDFAETGRIRLELGWKGNLVQLIGENRWELAPGTDFDRLKTEAGLREIAAVADGIGPWIGQLVLAEGGTVTSTRLAEAAQALGLAVHAYTPARRPTAGLGGLVRRRNRGLHRQGSA